MKSRFSVTCLVVSILVPGSANAAELEREFGLIVSGIAEQWVGLQHAEERSNSYDHFISGGEGLLSLPLGDNLSMQSDFKYEYTEAAFRDDIFIPRYFFQGAAHLSWRDPSSGLFGLVGGVGHGDFVLGGTSARFVGGEGQLYLDNVTLYAQGGYVDFAPIPTNVGLTDGFFARGVVRWFPSTDSRLQLEGTYIHSGFRFVDTELDSWSAKARYDLTVAGLPLVGDLPVFVAYRGTFRGLCNGSFDVDDHTFMVGTSYSFSGDRLAIDRQGATLDTPDFNFDCTQD